MRVLLVKRDDAGEPSLEGMALSATQAVNNHGKKHSNARVQWNMGVKVSFRKQSPRSLLDT